MKAMESPLGEKRGFPIQPTVSYKTFPTGNSKRVRPATLRTMAKSFPSGVQSANSTSFSTGRGVPPESRVRARVPEMDYAPVNLGVTRTGSSPADEAPSKSESDKPMARDSLPSGRVESNSISFPPQDAA